MILKKMRIIVLFCFCLFMLEEARASNVKGDGAKLVIETDRKVIKGFPLIIRVTAHGPQQVPRLSIFDEIAYVNVIFVSKEYDVSYIISSTRSQEIIVMAPDGRRNQTASQRMFEVSLKVGERRTMLLDVSSLRPELGKGKIFDGIQPGQYELLVEFPSSGIKSNAIDVEVISPSNKEKEYLHKVQSSGFLKRGEGVNWSKLLRDRLPMPENKIRKIGVDAQNQLRFHELLSRALRSEIRTSKDAQLLEVQEYLRPERDLLLMELGSSGVNQVESKNEAFDKQNAGIKWRLQNILEGRADFLRYRVKKKNK